MRCLQALSALCVLCALVGSAMAEQRRAPEAQAGAASSVEPASYYEPADVTNACLQQANQYNCRTVGCANTLKCNATRNPCINCGTNFVFQSDMTCCGSAPDKPDYSNYNKVEIASTGDAPDFQSPYLRVGTCDWDITVHVGVSFCLFNPTYPGCNIRRQDDSAVFASRIGSAWATCHLTEGAELCHGALCDKMVLTFQGSFYESAVKSTHSLAAFDLNHTALCGPRIPYGNQRAAGAKASLQQYDGYGGPKAEEGTFTGVAWIMSGAITVTSITKKVEYTSGHMDYVYDFVEVPEDEVANMFGTGEYTTVTPNTYKINLISGKKATY